MAEPQQQEQEPPAQKTPDEILQLIGVTQRNHRQAICDDLFPQDIGLANLVDENETDIKTTLSLYAKRHTDPFSINRVVIKRIVGLMFWVKDISRCSISPSIPANTSSETILKAISMSIQREELRKEQKKIGESFLSKEFQIKLKNQAHWQKWKTELETVLNTIIGANGCAIRYVIRPLESYESERMDSSDYDQMVYKRAPLSGPKFGIDAKTVHKVILQNIAEDSDAYTYIKPLLSKEDGRVDFQALSNRYESTATNQTIVNQAKQVLKTLKYKNERAYPFERFSAKLQSALDDLERCGRPENNENIVDELWDRISAPNLQGFIAALKVDYARNPRNYKEILQEIAAQAVNTTGGLNTTSTVAQVHIDTSKYTNDGQAPRNGVRVNGKIFVGKYTTAQWNSPSVRPFHEEIRAARESPQFTPTPNSHDNSKRRKGTYHRQKTKIAKLQARISELQTTQASTISTGGDTQTTVSSVTTTSNNSSTNNNTAGSAFGGRASMRNK